AALAGALDTLTHTQGTRPEGLGGSRDAGPAVAGPRPPYVTEAVRHSGCGYAVQRLRPYGPYGPYERRNVGRFYALFFDFCRYGYSYSYSYSYGKRPCYYSPFTASSFPLERSFRPDFFGCFFRPLVFLYRDDRNRVKIRIRIRIRIRNEIDSGIRVRAESSSYNGSYNSRYNSRYNRNNSSIRTYLWPYRTRPEGLRGLRNAGPAIAGPRPPYVIKAVRYSGYIKGL
ncbi:hypothetical protein L249_7121, partial [Ophiocordyceps polyrhachis-furcata BCC 54312]